MKAAFVSDVQKVEIREIEKPAIKDNEVLIKTETVGVCGSDLHLFRGTHAFRKPPAILGHEIAGVVVETGGDVKGIQPGDRVTVEPQEGCGTCEFCRAGAINLCGKKVVPGTPAWIGSFAEYFNAPATRVYKLADSVSFETGTLIEPLAVAVHALNRITVKEKDTMVILGAGTIGLLALVVALKMGYKKVVCTDTAPFNRKLALQLGADAALDPLSEDVPAIIKEMTGGRGADVAIVAAGAGNIVDQASASVRKWGEIGIVAMITEKIPVYTYSMVFNEQRAFGAMTYETADFEMACDMVNKGLDISCLVTHVMDFDHVQQALDILSQKKEDVAKVLVKL